MHVKAQKAGNFYELMAKLYIIKYDGIPPGSDLADVNPNLLTDKEVAAWDATQKEEEKRLAPEELEERQVEARRTLLYWKYICPYQFRPSLMRTSMQTDT